MITTGLVIITCVISYLAWTRDGLLRKLSHYPFLETREGQYYRLLTSGFVHGSWGHLFVNMFVLYQFGQFVELIFGRIFGPTKAMALYLLFYISAIVVANMGTFLKNRNNQGFSSVGASGVTTALVFIYVLFAPWEMFIFPPVPAIVFAILYVVYSTWASKNSRDNIDHLAHLWGGVYGVVFLAAVYPRVIDIFANQVKSGWPL